MKKRALTLIEILIVILLITLVTGVIGYNMRGALDKGKQFKTAAGKEKLHDLLMLAVAEGTPIHEVAAKPADALRKTGLISDPDKLLLDGWGEPYTITVINNGKDLKVVEKKKN